MATISKSFKSEALGVPDLGNGQWLIQDVAGKGLMQSIEAATRQQPEVTYTAGAKPQNPSL